MLQIVRDNIKYAKSQYAQSNMQVLQDINPMDDIRTCYEKLKSSQNVPKLTKQTSIQLPALSTQRQNTQYIPSVVDDTWLALTEVKDPHDHDKLYLFDKSDKKYVIKTKQSQNRVKTLHSNQNNQISNSHKFAIASVLQTDVQKSTHSKPGALDLQDSDTGSFRTDSRLDLSNDGSTREEDVTKHSKDLLSQEAVEKRILKKNHHLHYNRLTWT